MEIPEFLHIVECPFRLGLNTTVYVYGRRSKTFVDSGISLSPDYQVLPYLAAQGVEINQIKQLVNTHGHLDHTGGNARLRQVTNCVICAHLSDAAWIENHDMYYQESELKYSNYYPVPPGAKQTFDLASGASTKVDRYLSDGDKIDLEDYSLTVVHAPGHTRGCICLFDKEHKILFSGDSIQGTGLVSERFKLSVLPLYEDIEAYKASLRKLFQLDFDMVLPAHTYEPYGRIVLKGREGKGFIEESLAYVDQLERAVLETLKQAQAPMGVPEVTRRVPEKMLIQGLPSSDVYVVETHLTHLARAGVVRHNKADDTWAVK